MSISSGVASEADNITRVQTAVQRALVQYDKIPINCRKR